MPLFYYRSLTNYLLLLIIAHIRTIGSIFMQDKFYTVDEISNILGMHHKTIQRYIREGKLRAVKVGKAWRISGHDLSRFMESNKKFSDDKAGAEKRILVTSVVDIDVDDMDEAMSISNMLTASLNSKPSEYGRSSMSVQFLDSLSKLRIMLTGSAEFMETMMSFLTSYENKWGL